MEAQERRDEKTLDMTAALAIFVAIAATGAVTMWIADLLADWDDQLIGGFQRVVVVLAAAASVAYLVRVRSRER